MTAITSPSFAEIKRLAREDLIVDTVVNGRRLRMVASSVYGGEPPLVVWSGLLAVLGVKLFRRMRMTRVLRRKFGDKIEHVTIGGRAEIAIPLAWAAGAMSSEPGMPDGLEHELGAAAEFAVSRAGERILGIMPAAGGV